MAETAMILFKQKKFAAEITKIIGVGRANVPRYLEETG